MKKKTTTGNWWDILGTPQYGGEMANPRQQKYRKISTPYFSEGKYQHLRRLAGKITLRRLALDPAIWDYKMAWHPSSS